MKGWVYIPIVGIPFLGGLFLAKKFRGKPGIATTDLKEDTKVAEAIAEVEAPVVEAEEIVTQALEEKRGLTYDETLKVWKLLKDTRVSLYNALVAAAEDKMHQFMKYGVYFRIYPSIRKTDIVIAPPESKPSWAVANVVGVTAEMLEKLKMNKNRLSLNLTILARMPTVSYVIWHNEPDPKITPWYTVSVWKETRTAYDAKLKSLEAIKATRDKLKDYQADLDRYTGTDGKNLESDLKAELNKVAPLV